MPPKPKPKPLFKTSSGLNVPGAISHTHGRTRTPDVDAVGSGRDSLRPSPLPLSLSYGIGQDDDEAARDAVARSLAIDYPLLDESLILSLISDFASAEALEAALPSVRDTLGALEAGLVAEQEEQAEKRGSPDQRANVASSSKSSVSESKNGTSQASSQTSAPPTSSTTKSQLRKQERLARQKAREEMEKDDGSTKEAASRPAMSDHVTAWMAKLSARDDPEDPVSSGSPSPDDAETSSSSSAIKVADFGSEDATETQHPTREVIDGHRVVQPLAASGGSTPMSRSTSASEAATSDGESAGTSSTIEEGFAYGFLVEMFPTLLPELIRRTLVNHGIPADSENADLTKVIESLLSVELVREVEERGQWPDESRKKADLPADSANEKEETWTTKKAKQEKATKVVSPPPEEEAASPAGVPRPMDRPLSLTVPRYTDVRSKLAKDSPSGSRSSSPRPGSSIRNNADLIASSSGYASSGTESTASDSSVTRARRTQQPQRKASAEARRKKRSSLSPWDRLRSLAGWLAEIVPASAANESYFLSKFHAKSGTSLYSALSDALAPIAIPAARVKEELAVLKEVLGASDDALDQDHSLSLCATQGNISNAFDLYALLKELQDLESTKNAPEVRSAAPREAALASFKTEFEGQLDDMNVGTTTARSRNRKSRELHPQNWRTVRAKTAKTHVSDHPLAAFIPAYAKGPLSHKPLPAALNRRDAGEAPREEYDLDLCRQQAAELRQKRQRAVIEAGRQFRLKANSGATGRQVASFYAEEARRYESNARMWELRAARSLVKQQSQGRFSIDIHHLTVDEAAVVVQEEVQRWHDEQGNVPIPAKPFQVITGVGHHSPGYVGVLLPAMSNMLERNGWRVDRGPSGRGYLMVRGRAR